MASKLVFIVNAMKAGNRLDCRKSKDGLFTVGAMRQKKCHTTLKPNQNSIPKQKKSFIALYP